MSDNARPSRETLTAYVDGELSPEEMTRITVMLANDADLRAYVARQQALRNRLDEAFSAVIEQRVPERLQQAVRQAPLSRAANLSLELTKWHTGWLRLRSWPAAIPALAALALGLLVGVALDRSTVSQLPFVHDTSTGQLFAQGILAHTLDEQLASEDNRDSVTRIGVSFRSKGGEDCRSFTIAGKAASTAGVACHAGTAWVVAALATGAPSPNPSAPYQVAGAAMPSSIRDTINAMMAGAPFDARAEREARDEHWRGLR